MSKATDSTMEEQMEGDVYRYFHGVMNGSRKVNDAHEWNAA